ncbi:MAG: hypothetical protein H6559_10060 [Lewinellaceae bacterium]|nr:hypothetical protein [Lewinellaceae bacterium]
MLQVLPENDMAAAQGGTRFAGFRLQQMKAYGCGRNGVPGRLLVMAYFLMASEAGKCHLRTAFFKNFLPAGSYRFSCAVTPKRTDSSGTQNELFQQDIGFRVALFCSFLYIANSPIAWDNSLLNHFPF